MTTAADPFAGMSPAELAYLHSLNAQHQAVAATAPATSTANAVGQDAYDYVEKTFPQYAWMLMVPELAGVIETVAQQGITDQNQIGAAIEATNWWKTQSGDVRNWIQQSIQDPATTQEAVQSEKQNLQATTAQMGVTLSDSQLSALAYAQQMNGWSDQEVKNHVNNGLVANQDGSFSYHPYYIDAGSGKAVDTFTGRQAYYGPNNEAATPNEGAAIAAWGKGGYATGTFNGATVYYKAQPAGPTTAGAVGAGTLGSTEADLEAQAKAYLVNVSPQTLAQWSANIAAGRADTAGWTDYVRGLALSTYGQNPGMVQAINAGDTPSNHIEPYRQMIQTELGTDATGIDFTQPKWAKLLTTTAADGTVSENPVWQARQTLRSDPAFGWSQTPNARSAAFDLVAGLDQALGFRNFGGANFGAPAQMGAA